jgi:hypothetical protein
MAEGIEGLERTFLIILMTLATADLLTDSQRFGMRSGQAGDRIHLGTGGKYQNQSGQRQGGEYLLE